MSKTVTTPAGKTITYAYDAVGNRKFMLDPDGGRFTYIYDAADRLTTLYNLKSDSSVISSFEYSYDNAANRTHVVEANGDRVTWSYDDTYQLTAERRSGANAYAQTFVYDSVGNRLVKNADGSRTTTVYDTANQIEYSVDASGRTTYTFDANGNQQIVLEPNGDRTTNTWDYENLNTRVELPSATVATYTWNGDSHRVGKNVDGTETKMVWDEENILLETDGADATQVVYTLEPAVYGNLISHSKPGVTRYYQFDALGGTRELTDNLEVVTDTVVYDAWGNELGRTGSSYIVFFWVGALGYYYDSETGVYHIRRRPYDPPIARWTGVDPLLWTLLRKGRYMYGLNNPTNAVDPSGEVWWWPPNWWKKKPTKPAKVDCGMLEIFCCQGTITIPVYGHSERTKVILELDPKAVKPVSGCVTLPTRLIECTMSCNSIGKTEVNSTGGRRVPIMNHDACHMCLLWYEGLAAYLRSAGEAPDGCVGKEVPSKGPIIT